MREQRVQRGRPCWEGGGGDRRGVEQGVLSKVGGSRTAQVSEAAPSAWYYYTDACCHHTATAAERAAAPSSGMSIIGMQPLPFDTHITQSADSVHCTVTRHLPAFLKNHLSLPSSDCSRRLCVMKTGFQLTLRAFSRAHLGEKLCSVLQCVCLVVWCGP